MSGAHTPGPWVVVDGSESAHCCFEFSICADTPGRNNSIAEVLAGNRTDALLIAAAPDLLEALKTSWRELHACQAVIHLRGGFDPAYVKEAQVALKVIDAAIAKATGAEA